MRAVLATIVLSLILAGCGSAAGVKSGPAPVSTLGDSWKVNAPAGGGFRIALPANWATIDAATLAKQGASTFEKANPGLKGAASTLNSIASRPGALLGLDRSAKGKQIAAQTHFFTNIITRRADTGSTASDASLLDQVMQATQQSVAAIPGLKGPFISRGSIGGSPSKASTYSFDEKTASGTTINITEKDDFTVRKGILYGVSCTTVTSDVRRMNGICAHAVATFAFTR
jgi:hypothetical protein